MFSITTIYHSHNMVKEFFYSAGCLASIFIMQQIQYLIVNIYDMFAEVIVAVGFQSFKEVPVVDHDTTGSLHSPLRRDENGIF